MFRKLNSAQVTPLDAADLSVWSTFLMSLLHRTPENLAAYKETARRIYDETMPEIRADYSILRGPNDPETVEEYEASLTWLDRERAIMRNFTRVILNQKIGNFLNALHWSVMDLPHDCPEFLLSDDPLARSNGIEKADGHMAIPISPRRLAVGVYEPSLLAEFKRLRPKELVTRMNIWTVEGARNFVVATDLTQKRFIENRFGRSPRPGFARNTPTGALID